MPNHALTWALAALALVLVFIPPLDMFGVMNVGQMVAGVDTVDSATLLGTVWFLVVTFLVGTLVVTLVEETAHA